MGKAARWRHGAPVLAATISAILGGWPAHAQAQPRPPAETDRSFDFAIPSKPLLAALVDFTAITGIQIIRAGGEAIGGTAPAVAGRMSASQALRALLAGSGLDFRMTQSDTATLIVLRAGADGSVQLPEVRVDAGATRGWSPVRGYVAEVSATGTKTDTPLMETPQSISVVTRDQMVAQGSQRANQALRYTSGIATEGRAGFGGYEIMYSRGFGVDRYVDGMRLQGNSGFVTPQYDIFGLERVEFLRGPASVLYGQGSPAGIVNMVSRRPSATPQHEVYLQAGSRGNLAGGFDSTGPLDADGRWLYRLTTIGRTDNTQVDYTRAERVAIAPALTWRPSDRTSLTFLGLYQRDPRAGLYNFVPAAGSLQANPTGVRLPRSFYSGDPNFNRIDRTQYAAGYLFEHRFDETWTVRQNLRYLQTEGHLDQVLPLSLAANGRTLNRYVQADRETTGAFTVDNQVQARIATGPVSHTVLAGLDLQNTRWTQALGQAVGPSLDLLNPVYGMAITRPAITTHTRQRQNQLGLYAQDQMRLGNLSLVLSGRQDWAESKTTNLIRPGNTSQDDQRFTWRAGLIYNFDLGLAPYASYATSFQPIGGTNFGGAPFRPTNGEQYEVGLKYQPPGINSSITVAAYHLTQQNVLTVDAAHPSFSVQTGEVRSRGIEVEGRASLRNGLDLIASYAYVDAEVTRSNGANLGKRPLFIPAHLASVWADYTIPSGQLNGLGFGGGVRYVGPSYGNDANTIRIRDYTLLDALIHYDLGRVDQRMQGMRLAVNATNLLDRSYVSNCTNATNCLYGTGRTVIGSVTYRW